MAVTANGIASDTHKEAMSMTTPRVRQPSSESPAGGFMSRTKTSEATPEKGTASFNHDPADMFCILPCRSARASLPDEVGVGSSPETVFAVVPSAARSFQHKYPSFEPFYRSRTRHSHSFSHVQNRYHHSSPLGIHPTPRQAAPQSGRKAPRAACVGTLPESPGGG